MTVTRHCRTLLVLLATLLLVNSQLHHPHRRLDNHIKRRASKLSHLPADYRVDKSIQLFSDHGFEHSASLRCDFNLPKVNRSTTPVSHIVEWLKYDSSDLRLLSIFPSLAEDSSELKFDGNLNDTHGIYVCKLKHPGQNGSVIAANSQYTQEINFNEVIQFKNTMSLIHFDLNYTISQVTSQRAIVEIKSLDANFFSDNNNFKLIYSVEDVDTKVPVVRGTIDVPIGKKPANYLVIEGLLPATNYSLSIHLKSNMNPLKPDAFQEPRSYVFSLSNRAFQTQQATKEHVKSTSKKLPGEKKQSAFQIIKKKLSMSAQDINYEQEYDYDQDYDDLYDYDVDVSALSNDNTIVGCQTDLVDLKNQFITFSYNINNLNNLVVGQINMNRSLVNQLTADLDNYKERFHLNNLNWHGLDYAIYKDCSRQLTSNSLLQISKPFCLFNTAALWSSLEPEVGLSSELFSVQTALQSNGSTIYIASRCQNQQKQEILNNFIKQSPLNVEDDARIISTDNKSETSTATTASTKSPVTPIRTTIGNNKEQKFQQLTTSSKIYQLKSPNVSSCLILNENEMQFRIEHPSTNLKYLTPTKPVLVYYIEFESAELAANNLIFTDDNDNLLESIQQHHHQVKKFFIKKEKDIQVVTINFIHGNYKIPAMQDKLPKPIQLDIKEHLRSRRGGDERSKTKPLVIATESTLLEPEVRTSSFKVKIKLFSESSSHSSNFTQINVMCRRIYNDTQVLEEKTNGQYGRVSKIGLALTLLFTLILIMSGFFVCAIMKNKFGLSPEYFLNLKNSILLKSGQRSNSNNNLNSIHSSVLNLKKQSSKSGNANNPLSSFQQQYQLQFKLGKLKSDCVGNGAAVGSILSSNNYSYSSATTPALATNIKNPMFSMNYEDLDSIGIDLFELYVQKMHVDGDFGFVQLYEEITNAVRTFMFQAEISLLEANKCKNRYSNIVAYDHSRVKLSADEKVANTEGYINANYVNGYQKPNAYIATQGPMPNTFGDFWRMVWEKNCSIVCMITNVMEKGRIKCDQYWPDEEQSKCYGNFQVTHIHTITLAFYTKRIFTIKLKNAKKRSQQMERLVYQFHFTDWPDHGVPYYIMPVLAFIKQSSRANPELGGPIVVHCSAGVGRTGTYIVIDAMMKQIMDKGTINVHNFLKHIRHQRNYLVQTEEQFIFIYDVLLESLKSGETELNESNYKQFLASLDQPISDNCPDTKLIDRQFQLITEYRPSEWQVSFSQLAYNQDKNRTQSILPVNSSRAILSRKPGVDGSDYINASYLHGCSRQDEFLVTQYPLPHTKSSFWQMVWDNNSNQIVTLNSDETEVCEPYWLPLGEPMKCDSFTIILREENFDIDFIVRDFSLQSNDEDYEFQCRMISTTYWPDSVAPIKSAFELINKVREFRNQSLAVMAPTVSGGSLNSPPIIVHDLNGGYRAGTFCALYVFQDLIQLENTVNVYELAKMFHLKRPGIWQSPANIMFLYNSVDCLFDQLMANGATGTNLKLLLACQNNQSRISSSSSAILLNTKNSSLTHINNTNGSTTRLSKQVNTQTFTLPNIGNFNQNKLASNDVIGSRLYNFQSQIQKSRNAQGYTDESLIDPSITIPLTDQPGCAKGQTKTGFSIPGIPRFPFMKQQNSQEGTNEINNFRRSFMKNFSRGSRDSKSGSNRSSFNVNSRAAKFMTSMYTKSSSFRKALFPKHSNQLTSSSLAETDSTSNNNNDSNPNPLIINLASGSEISASSDNSTGANDASLNSKSALIQPIQTSSSVSPIDSNSGAKLPDLPETTIKTQQSIDIIHQNNMTSII